MCMYIYIISRALSHCLRRATSEEACFQDLKTNITKDVSLGMKAPRPLYPLIFHKISGFQFCNIHELLRPTDLDHKPHSPFTDTLSFNKYNWSFACNPTTSWGCI